MNQLIDKSIIFDIENNRRITDGNNDSLIVIDMGAYEYQTQTNLYDINGDGYITIRDTIMILKELSGITTNLIYLSSDHQISIKDAIISIVLIGQ